MSGKYRNYLIRYNMQFIVIFIVILTPLRAPAFRLPMVVENEPVVLMSWKDYKFTVETPTLPDACRKSDVCETAENYPTDLVKIIMDELAKKNITTFTNDQLDEIGYSNVLAEVLELCRTQGEKIIYPRAAKDSKNTWQFILNIPGHRFQSFRVHECLDVPEVICSEAVKINATDYRLKCEQQFTRKKMVYLDLEKNLVQTGYFSVPSCCSYFLEPS